VTPHVDVARRLQLVGSNPIGPRPASAGQTFRGYKCGSGKAAAFPGDLVVMSAGTLQGIAGSTDLIKVEVVTAVLGHGVGLGQVSGRHGWLTMEWMLVTSSWEIQ